MGDPSTTTPRAVQVCIVYAERGFFLHRAVAPFGSRWITACDAKETGLSLPQGMSADSAALIRCRRCFPPAPPDPPPSRGGGPER